MAVFNPATRLATHEVTNQPPPFVDVNLYTVDQPLREAVGRDGARWAEDRFKSLGKRAGSAEVMEWADLANRNPPELRRFDRYGQRIDEVAFHPAYHALMDLGISHGVSSIAWTAPYDAGGHAAHAVLHYLMSQAEPGVCCPMTMTYASVPALRHQPEVALAWEEIIETACYDPASRPRKDKAGATVGMAMTEKQGGSDVRSNTTRARPLGRSGPGRLYSLTGHKWFCSAPMSDGFLTLAYTNRGLSCFLVPRWREDGSRNDIHIMRLKDKLGDRANASSEIEYHDAEAVLIGDEGRGLSVIMEMVQHTRLDTIIAPAAFMRQSLVQAIWHTTHRSAFQKRLIDQPMMHGVLSDLALESEAATATFMRLARAYDEAPRDEEAAALARIATPVCKYWINRRTSGAVVEAMECLGGAGYVEESILPRLYRQAPLNGIWEGSGNVICLDVLRAIERHPDSVDALFAEYERARGGNRLYDGHLDTARASIDVHGGVEIDARRLIEYLALMFQASQLIRHTPASVSDAFCHARLSDARTLAYGTLARPDETTLIERALPLTSVRTRGV